MIALPSSGMGTLGWAWSSGCRGTRECVLVDMDQTWTLTDYHNFGMGLVLQLQRYKRVCILLDMNQTWLITSACLVKSWLCMQEERSFLPQWKFSFQLEWAEGVLAEATLNNVKTKSSEEYIKSSESGHCVGWNNYVLHSGYRMTIMHHLQGKTSKSQWDKGKVLNAIIQCIINVSCLAWHWSQFCNYAGVWLVKAATACR